MCVCSTVVGVLLIIAVIPLVDAYSDIPFESGALLGGLLTQGQSFFF